MTRSVVITMSFYHNGSRRHGWGDPDRHLERFYRRDFA
jgi:hypothetical protein